MVQSEGINPESQSRFEKYLYLKPTLHYSALGQEIGVTPVTATLSLYVLVHYTAHISLLIVLAKSSYYH